MPETAAGTASGVEVRKPPVPGPSPARLPRGALTSCLPGSATFSSTGISRGLTGPDGRSTNAVFGFITMLRKLMAEQSPELIAAAFELKGPTTRPTGVPIPADLVEQVPGCTTRARP